jgi:hypothetical protein
MKWKFQYHWVRKSIQMLGFPTTQYASIQSKCQPKCKRWINPIQKAKPEKNQLDGQERFTCPMIKYCLFSSYIKNLKGNDANPNGIHEFDPSGSSQSSARSMALLGSLVAIVSCPATGVGNSIRGHDSHWGGGWGSAGANGEIFSADEEREVGPPVCHSSERKNVMVNVFDPTATLRPSVCEGLRQRIEEKRGNSQRPGKMSTTNEIRARN